jgi:hypothetical protein
MYVRGMRSCHGYPGETWWKPINGTNLQVVYPNVLNQGSTYLKQMNLFRTYRPPSSSAFTSNSTSDRLRIGVMRHMSDARFGFLGKRASAPGSPYNTYPSWKFTKCSSIRTCSIQPFTVYGYVVERRIRRVGAAPVDPIEGIKRSSLDTYKCGPYGYLTSDPTGVCAMDLSVVPLYRAMCYSQSSRLAIRTDCSRTLVSGGTEAAFVSEWCSKFISTIGGATCDGKPYTFRPPQTGNPTMFPDDGYIPTWTADVESLREGIPCLLNRLARDVVYPLKSYRFPADKDPSTQDYINATTCAQTIHDAITSTAAVAGALYTVTTAQDTTRQLAAGASMYHFSSYGMYEYPFSWLVKCSFMVGRLPDNNQVRSMPIVACRS